MSPSFFYKTVIYNDAGYLHHQKKTKSVVVGYGLDEYGGGGVILAGYIYNGENQGYKII